MRSGKTNKKQIKKDDYWNRIQDVVYKYKNVLFVDADNVSSLQVAKLRVGLRAAGAYMIMGKNTLMRAALQAANTKRPDANIDLIIAQLRGNINLIFTNGDVQAVKAVLDQEVRGSPAKVGMRAPKDVFIPAGPTGMDPRQTAVFGQLKIATKIAKAQINVINATKIIDEGAIVNSSQAALLDKLKILPFEYKMVATKVLQDGKLYGAECLDITTDSILAKLKNAALTQTALALGSGTPTSLSVPHSILNGFKNLVAAAAASGHEFPAAHALLAVKAPAVEVADAESPSAAATDDDDVVAVADPDDEAVNLEGLFGFGGDDDDDY